MSRKRLGFAALRDFVFLSGGELVGKGVGFLAFAYLARMLDPESYGAVELAFSLVLLFGFVVEFGTDQIGAREVAHRPSVVPELARHIPAARLVVAVFAVPAMAALAVAMNQPEATTRLIWVFSLALLTIPWKATWLLQGLEMMSWISLGGALRMVVFAAGVFVLVSAPDDLMRVAWIEVGAGIGYAIYFMVIQGRQITPLRMQFSFSEMRRLLRRGLPLGLTQAVWSATQYLPTLLVATFVGGAAIAWFGAAHRIVMSVWTFSWLYHFNLFPAVTRNLAHSERAFHALVQPSLRACGWAGLGIALVVTLLGEPACTLIFGAPFVEAGPTLSVLVWIVPATLISGHARSALIATGKQRFVLYAQSAGGLVMLALGILLVPSQGALGGAIAMAISSTVVLLVSHTFAVRWVAPIPLVPPLLRPAIGLALAFGVVAALAPPPWWDAALAGVVYTLFALLVDRGLISDLRRIAAAKDASIDLAGDESVDAAAG